MSVRPSEHRPDPPLWRKLAWFVGLWIAGVAAVGLVAGLIRYWLS